MEFSVSRLGVGAGTANRSDWVWPLRGVDLRTRTRCFEPGRSFSGCRTGIGADLRQAPDRCMTGACEDESGRGRKGQVCGSWSHRLLWGQAANADEMAGGAARADPRLRRFWRLGQAIGGVFSRSGLMRRGRAVEQEQQTGSSCEIALGGVPQAKVADLVEPFGQNMLQEPAHELFTRDPAGDWTCASCSGW